MNFQSVEICCPACRGDLGRRADDSLFCAPCNRNYPIVFGIPDLRLSPDPYIGFEEERAKVEKLIAHYHKFDFPGFVDFYYSITSVVPPKHAQQFRRGLMAGVSRAESWLEQWEAQAQLDERGALLEIGCGTAPLLVAAKNYQQRVGVDIALRWLIVAKKRFEQERLDLPLLCANAESLPFSKPTFSRVVFDSSLEHLRDHNVALKEAYRTLIADGALFVSTPNRHTIGPDPHTGVPFGTFLPDSVTAAIVRRAGGIPPKRSLQTVSRLRRLLRQAGFSQILITLPAISERQRAHFSGLWGVAIRAYELVRVLPVGKHLLLRLGPLLMATARKP